jgi:hypothetical protein
MCVRATSTSSLRLAIELAESARGLRTMTPDRQLAALQARFAERWQLWYVPRATQPGQTWCALRWTEQDDRTLVRHANSPDELARDIELAEREEAHS